jgi:creatinine amidohydrolase
MRLSELTWEEAAAHFSAGGGVILPAGSTEQHGPVGLIGTDAFCAEDVAMAAAARCGAVVAPPLAYAPAEFNMAFPGTVSVSEEVFARLAGEVIDALARHGAGFVYVLNAHGANLAPLEGVLAARPHPPLRLRSWWDFAAVGRLRAALYGDWEGMHATPSEIAITQVSRRRVEGSPPPPEKLSPEFPARACRGSPRPARGASGAVSGRAGGLAFRAGAARAWGAAAGGGGGGGGGGCRSAGAGRGAGRLELRAKTVMRPSQGRRTAQDVRAAVLSSRASWRGSMGCRHRESRCRAHGPGVGRAPPVLVERAQS